MGSAATDDADDLSDLDLITYYDEIPSSDAIAAARGVVGADAVEQLGGSRDEGGFAESWLVDGVECQVALRTVTKQERDMAAVLEHHDAATPLHKMMSGLLEGVAIRGEDLIGEWKTRAAVYPEELATVVVVHHLRFFPLWYVGDRLARGDALLWHHQARVEGLQNILGVLAGINHLYYSTFQFKRMRRFVAAMTHVPSDLATRVESVLTAAPPEAGAELESLVLDTVQLVERYMPHVDTTPARRYLGRRQVSSSSTSPESDLR